MGKHGLIQNTKNHQSEMAGDSFILIAYLRRLQTDYSKGIV